MSNEPVPPISAIVNVVYCPLSNIVFDIVLMLNDGAMFAVKLFAMLFAALGVLALSVTTALKLKLLLFVGLFVRKLTVLLPTLGYMGTTYEGLMA